MAAHSTHDVLQHLQTGLAAAGNRIASLKGYPSAVLACPPPDAGWSIAQVLEHLNFYSRYYNERFDAAIRTGLQRGRGPRDVYRSGWLGDYFVGLMAPKADGTVAKKMKAPASSAPAPQADAAAVLAEFEALQQQLLQRVREAASVRLDGIRVPTMLPLVSLRLGDAFRFLLAHQERHLAQVVRTLEAVRTA